MENWYWYALIILNAFVTASLWQRRRRVWSSRPKKKYLRKLLHSEPITPKHEPSVKLPPYDDDRRFFVDFKDFAEVVNCWLADEHVRSRWRVQELPEMERKLAGPTDGPLYGRCYAAFYNHENLGRVEVSAGFEYSTDKPNVSTQIQIRWARLLHFDAITDFLHAIALHVCDPKPMSEEYQKAHQSFIGAMTKVLWNNQRITEYEELEGLDWGDLEVSLVGAASWYIRRRDARRQPSLSPKILEPRW